VPLQQSTLLLIVAEDMYEILQYHNSGPVLWAESGMLQERKCKGHSQNTR